ncbi:MAG: hypothetical protein EA394_10740 [Bacteroidia bacterium]|nr:MAG: hypothetical protein EA394_10740 [Bacteroidia bacterium]
MVNTFERIIDGLFRVVSIMAGIFFSVIAVMAILLFVSLLTGITPPFSNLFDTTGWVSLQEFLLNRVPGLLLSYMALAGLVFVVGIPLLLVLGFGLSLIFHTGGIHRSWKITAFVFWIIGVFLLYFTFLSGVVYALF